MNPAFEGSSPSLFKKKKMVLIVNRFKNNNNKKTKGIIYGFNFNQKIEFKIKEKYYYTLKKNNKITLININKKYKVIIKNIKKHSFKKIITHVEFLIQNE